MQINGLQYLGETDWSEIFKVWQANEGIMPSWQELATKQKGYKSWEEWRTAWVKNFDAQSRQWFRYEIIDPIKIVPNFYVGPTKAWQGNFMEKKIGKNTFSDLVGRVVFHYKKVGGILKNFPEKSEFIGVCLPGNKVVLIEGHHRASAIAVSAKNGTEISFKQLPTISLTFFQAGEENLLDDLLLRGSAK